MITSIGLRSRRLRDSRIKTNIPLLFIFPGASAVTINQNHEGVTIPLGESVELVCTANTKAQACSFTSPKGEVLTIVEGAR